MTRRYRSTGKCIECRKIIDTKRNGGRKRGGLTPILRSAENYLMDDQKSPLELLRDAVKATPSVAAATAALTEKGRHDDAAAVVAAFGALKAAVTLLEAEEGSEKP